MPLYVYVRSRGYRVDDAEDLTQRFFAPLLNKQLLKNVQRERGKFRNYLLTSMQHFVDSEHRMDEAKNAEQVAIAFQLIYRLHKADWD